jgi:hypothetical protein
MNSNWNRSTTFRRRRSIPGLAGSRLAFQRSSRVSNRVCKRKPMALASSSRGCASVVPVRGDGNETRLNGVIYPRCALPHMQIFVYEHDGRFGTRTWNREPTRTSNMYWFCWPVVYHIRVHFESREILQDQSRFFVFVSVLKGWDQTLIHTSVESTSIAPYS